MKVRKQRDMIGKVKIDNAEMYIYDYEMPSITASTVILNSNDEVLLIKRGKDPYKGHWALPGGFMNMGETTKQCAIREVLEEAGIDLTYRYVELHTVSDVPNRDPRGRVVDFVYHSRLPNPITLVAGDDACEAKFFSLSEVNELNIAFDHKEVLLKYFVI